MKITDGDTFSDKIEASSANLSPTEPNYFVGIYMIEFDTERNFFSRDPIEEDADGDKIIDIWSSTILLILIILNASIIPKKLSTRKKLLN